MGKPAAAESDILKLVQAARAWNNDIDYEATNEGLIPVYQSDPNDPMTADAIIGYWEQVRVPTTQP